jgi:hypothetical protein
MKATRFCKLLLVVALVLSALVAGCGAEDGGTGDLDAWAGASGLSWNDAAWKDEWSANDEDIASPTTETRLQPLYCSNITHMSQNATAYKCNLLGTCAKTTIGTCTGNTPAGCAVAAVAMLLKSKGAIVDPAKLNAWLKANGGFASGCLIIWATAANFDGSGGLVWKGTGSITTIVDLKAKFDAGYRIVSSSKRFSSGHWVTLLGYSGTGTKWSDFKYFDPWDTTATTRSLGDGWVGSGASLRLFK